MHDSRRTEEPKEKGRIGKRDTSRAEEEEYTTYDTQHMG
jgi:hypothetical protein